MHQNGLLPIIFREFVEPVKQKVPNRSLAVYDAAIRKRKNELLEINSTLNPSKDALAIAEKKLNHWQKQLEIA